jgi:hypothetical protein
MNKTITMRLIWLLLVAQALIGCAQPTSEKEPSSTATPASFKRSETSAEAVDTPTSIVPSPTSTGEPPVTKVVPVPLPTTIPNQAELLAQAAEEGRNSVDFVIDTMELDDGKVPWRFATGANWYKYTSPGGEFSILMLSSIPPKQASDSNPQQYEDNEVNVVSSSFAVPMIVHRVIYYDAPGSVVGDVETKGFLDAYQFSDTTKIIQQTDIELGGYHGREFVGRIWTEGEPDLQFDMRTRIYVIEGSVYRLIVTGVDPEEVFGENGDRFLDSFTPNTSSN